MKPATFSREPPASADVPSSAIQPSSVRAWFSLVRLSIRRQARAHWMVWIALGLLAFTVLVVYLNARAGRFGMFHWRYPRRQGPTYADFLSAMTMPAWNVASQPAVLAATGAIRAALARSGGFFVFSNWVVFSIFTTFLLPLWSLSFATEALGREREARNLIWVLTRPLSRPAIYLAKFLAMLPWCLALNVGGFGLICLAGGQPGRLAFALYWPAVLWGTLAFCSLFHLLGAWFRRPAIVAILYAFFLETILGNLPGHMKRLSISFYTRCIMFDSAHDLNIRPERASVYLPVDGTMAMWVLAGITVACLGAGMWLFSRAEYLESS